MPVTRNTVRQDCFNADATLPYALRLKDFEMAMQDIYDFFYDINKGSSGVDSSGWMTYCAPPSCLAFSQTC